MSVGLKASGVPRGYRQVEGYISEQDGEVVILGQVDSSDESHNCDAMGCSSVSHVLYRLPLLSVYKARKKNEALSDALKFLRNPKNLAGGVQVLQAINVCQVIKGALNDA